MKTNKHNCRPSKITAIVFNRLVQCFLLCCKGGAKHFNVDAARVLKWLVCHKISLQIVLRWKFFSFRSEVFAQPEAKLKFVRVKNLKKSFVKMEKLNRSQLPDSSSSPPLSGIFHNFDDEAMSDLPSCIYANVHHHHQLNSGQISINSLGMMPSGNQSPSANNSMRMNANSFKIHQHFMHHGELPDAPATSTSSPVMSNFSGPIKNSRQNSAAVRERKRTMRSAPNGYLRRLNLIDFDSNFFASSTVPSIQHSMSFAFTSQHFHMKSV